MANREAGFAENIVGMGTNLLLVESFVMYMYYSVHLAALKKM